MWYGREWSYEGKRMSEMLNVLQEMMLIQWRQKLTIEFSQVIRRIFGSWKRVGFSQGIIYVVGEYVHIEVAHYSEL